MDFSAISAHRGSVGNFRPNTGSAHVGVQQGYQVLLGDHTDLLLHHFAVFENQKGGYATDSVAGGNVGVAVHVQLAYHRFAFHIAGDFFDHRADHTAGSAPFGPEINEHRLRGVQDGFLKIGISDYEGHVLKFNGLMEFVGGYNKNHSKVTAQARL
jgi:hypothetical protein